MNEAQQRYRRVLQFDDYSCFACCAAMATGEGLLAVIRYCGDSMGRGYRFTEIAQYLSSRGYNLGTGTANVPANLEDYTHLTLEWDMSHPAIVLVESKSHPEDGHAVFWTGENVLDPCPSVSSWRKLSDYKVLQFWPVVKFI